MQNTYPSGFVPWNIFVAEQICYKFQEWTKQYYTYACILISASLSLSSESVPLQIEDLEDLPGIIPAPSLRKLAKVEASPGLIISIDAGKDVASSRVSVSGYMQHIISDTERMSFHLSDYELKQAVGKYHGKNPDDAFLHSPTPWNDLYKTYGWDQVQTVLVPVSYQILGVTTNSRQLKTVPLENFSSKTGTFSASIWDTRSNKVTSTWQMGGSLTFGQKIIYEVGFEGTKVGGETSLSFSETFGVGGSNEKSQVFGSKSGVTVTLKPHQTITAVLTATQGVMRIRVQYNAYLIGRTAVNYGSRFKGHHFWALPIKNVMAAGSIKNSVRSTEDIEVGYYSNGKITLKDSDTDKVLATHYL